MGKKSFNLSSDTNESKLPTGQVNVAFVSHESDLNNSENQNNEKTLSNIQYEKGENRRMLKNVIVTSIAFMFLFTAFQSMAVLQNSLYPTSEGGLGTWSLSTVYVGLICGSLLLPTFVINKLTIKYTVFASMFGYILYICAQFYPEFYTLVPAAFITGLCASCLWSAKCTYLTILGHEYGKLTSQNSELMIVRFFGIFFFFFQSASVWGNLISSLVLGSGQSKEGNDPEICGINYCPSTNLGNATLNQDDDDDKTTLYVLAGIYLGCAVAAVIIIFTFLDPLHRYGEKKREGTPGQLIMATAVQMKHPYQILLIPLTIWSGMEQGFWGADFTAGFVTCSSGIKNVGFVMICYGVADAISSISFGPIIKHFGRVPVFIFGAAINIAVIVTMFEWLPNSDEMWVLYTLAALWGIADGIWQCEINAFYGILFPNNEEAAFSNYRLWESLGFVIAYVNTNFLCIDAKLYLLLVIIVLGMLGYFVIEFLERRKRNRSGN